MRSIQEVTACGRLGSTPDATQCYYFPAPWCLVASSSWYGVIVKRQPRGRLTYPAGSQRRMRPGGERIAVNASLSLVGAPEGRAERAKLPISPSSESLVDWYVSLPPRLLQEARSPGQGSSLDGRRRRCHATLLRFASHGKSLFKLEPLEIGHRTLYS